MPTKKPGPKPRPSGQVRKHVLGIRVTYHEARALRAAARSRGVSLSDFVREASLASLARRKDPGRDESP